VVPAIFLAAAIVVAIGYVNGLSGRTLSLALLAMLVSLELGYLVGCFGAAYLVGPDNPRCATAPADRIALAVLATGIILFAVFYEHNSRHDPRPRLAAPDLMLPVING
jgi:hypothetical protein